MTKRYFEFVEGSSSKFWEVWREGSKVMTRYGKIGADGQTTVKDEGDEAKATKLHDKLVGEKTKKGYSEKGAAKAAAPKAAAPAPASKNAPASKAAGPAGGTVPSLSGKAVVVTGTFAGMPRKEIEAILVASGATLGSSVTKKTQLLIVGADAGSKLAKAEELGVEIMEESDFNDLLAGAGGSAPAAKNPAAGGPSDLRTRWDAMISELKAQPSVKISKAKLTPPMSEAEVAKVVKRLGLPLTADLRAFLELCDGMNLSWTTKSLDGYTGGMIAIPSLGTLDDQGEWPCGPDALEGPLAAYGVDFEEAQGNVVPFDFFLRTEDEIEIAVMLPRGKTLDVFTSNDQTACLEDSALLSFGEYLDLLFRSFGSPMARAALQLGSSNTEAKRAADVIPGILTRTYSLDALIELTRSEPDNEQVREFFRGPEGDE